MTSFTKKFESSLGRVKEAKSAYRHELGQRAILAAQDRVNRAANRYHSSSQETKEFSYALGQLIADRARYRLGLAKEDETWLKEDEEEYEVPYTPVARIAGEPSIKGGRTKGHKLRIPFYVSSRESYDKIGDVIFGITGEYPKAEPAYNPSTLFKSITYTVNLGSQEVWKNTRRFVDALPDDNKNKGILLAGMEDRLKRPGVSRY
jgi:hypothetical protein